MKGNGLTCGGKRGGRRLRRRFQHTTRRAEQKLPVQSPRERLWPELEWALVTLHLVPGPWSPDLDNPVYDHTGRIVDGEWTGKVYTNRLAFCLYLDEYVGVRGHDGFTTARIIIALCVLITHLPELVRLARIGKANGG
jgi:hypothetical protein